MKLFCIKSATETFIIKDPEITETTIKSEIRNSYKYQELLGNNGQIGVRMIRMDDSRNVITPKDSLIFNKESLGYVWELEPNQTMTSIMERCDAEASGIEIPKFGLR
jgi:hypothetical protein